MTRSPLSPPRPQQRQKSIPTPPETALPDTHAGSWQETPAPAHSASPMPVPATTQAASPSQRKYPPPESLEPYSAPTPQGSVAPEKTPATRASVWSAGARQTAAAERPANEPEHSIPKPRLPASPAE